MWPHNWAKQLWRSLNDVTYYGKEATALSWLQLWRYLVTSLIFISAVSLSISFTKTYFELSSVWHDSLAELHNRYPEDLEFSWQNAENGLKMKPETELVVPWPVAITESAQRFSSLKISLPTNLAYFSTAVTSVDELKDIPVDPSLVVITNQELGTKNLWNDGWDTLKIATLFEDGENFHFTKDTVNNEYQVWEKDGLQLLKLFLPILGVLTVVFSVATKTLSIVIDSFILLFFGRLMIPKLRWKITAMLAFHIGVLAEVVNQLAIHLYPAAAGTIFSLSFWVMLSFVVWRNQKILASK